MKISTSKLRWDIGELEVLIQDNRITLPKKMEPEDLSYFQSLLSEVIDAANYFNAELDLYMEREKEND
jgi:hypothetical protein